MDPRGSVSVPRRADASPGYRPVSARQYRYRRAVVLVAVLSLVALIGGCLGRSGPAPVQLARQQPLTRRPVVSAPRPPRIVASGVSSGRWLVYLSVPLRAGPPQTLCGTDQVRLVAPTQLAVSQSATACQTQLQLTAQNGEQASFPVKVPALSRAKVRAVPVAKLYCFANPAGRAIYITIDDGWTPSAEVLALMHQTYLPITAFLIADAARENLSYWKAFVAAGGIIGDHTVSHPYLTKVTQARAKSQWGQARTALGRWLGQTPAIGRPPYGAFNRKVEVAAARAGLTALAGWSATMSGNRIQTWNGKPLVPGEIVILHWVPGLGRQLTALLAAIRALHLNPKPLTLASFSGIAPQQRSLNGD
ncbi:MAG: polysaccharide deacetylase family protein [Streptosporangiaceae bacterium]